MDQVNMLIQENKNSLILPSHINNTIQGRIVS